MNHIELGNLGEATAVEHLKKRGHEILAQNYRFARAEIDIVSKVGDIMVVSEVKTRRGTLKGDPGLSITITKQRQILKATNQFMKERNIDLEVRFDVFLLNRGKSYTRIRHIENAFYPVL